MENQRDKVVIRCLGATLCFVAAIAFLKPGETLAAILVWIVVVPYLVTTGVLLILRRKAALWLVTITTVYLVYSSIVGILLYTDEYLRADAINIKMYAMDVLALVLLAYLVRVRHSLVGRWL